MASLWMTSYSGSSLCPLASFKEANSHVFVVVSSDLDGADVKIKLASNEQLNPTGTRMAK